MYFIFKRSLFRIGKYVGIFSLFRFINSKKVPILCYHGGSTIDEHKFMPSNFMQFEVFKKRIKTIKDLGYEIISLDDALEMYKEKSIQKNKVVITIDDGFVSIFDKIIPFLAQEKIPVTVYITSYKSQKEIPIFRLIAQYYFWKTDKKEFYSEHRLLSKKSWNITTDGWDLIKEVEKTFSRLEKQEFIKELSEKLKVEYNQKVLDAFRIADYKLLEKFKNNIDFQLHTHYHNMNLPLEELDIDFQKNIEYLKDLNSKKQVHFCFPSGVWRERHFLLLKKYDIQTATTCDSGLFSLKSNLYTLPRIIDSNNMSQISFESELCGLSSFLRTLVNKKFFNRSIFRSKLKRKKI